MKRLDVRKYLCDIKQACELIGQFTSGKTFDDYADDPLLRSGVERQFTIVGEALRAALEVDPDLVEDMSATRRIIAFRNRLVHGYASMSDKIVWGVIESHLPTLRREVAALLGDEPIDMPELDS
jgi:uncharacterized protein with HEPN domain